jgi:hypothetical protein
MLASLLAEWVVKKTHVFSPASPTSLSSSSSPSRQRLVAKSPAVGRQVASKQQTKMIVESLEREFIVKATPIIKKVALNPKTDFRRGFARSK